MTITLANHYGMCFGVRDALRKAFTKATSGPTTVLGELVHNPRVQEKLTALGVQSAALETPGSSRTQEVIITAHGAANRDHQAWKNAGYRVTDTTCPLVRKAHDMLGILVAAGHHPVVIGQAQHVEVRGLCGDFPGAIVIENETAVTEVPLASSYGVVAQTTQPHDRVLAIVEALRQARPQSRVEFRDTVCQPTRQRQDAMATLCAEQEIIIVIGGRTSNNTRQLVLRAKAAGRTAYQVESAAELQRHWFTPGQKVGVTAGTSTLDETVEEVMAQLRAWGEA